MPPRPAAIRRLVVGLGGPVLLPAEAAWLRRWRPAGVILFARNVNGLAQLRQLCAELRSALPPGAEIVADQEGGPVAPLAMALGRPPAAWSLGTLDDPELTRRVHRQTAAAARAAGLDRLLAPCADVLYEPANPVIAARAFGGEAALVARHVTAAVAGLREGGVAACLKHWPGHGGSAQDSHDGPVRDPAGALEEQQGPFRAGLAAGADAVMLGHLPAGDPDDPSRPATLSPAATARARRLAPPGGPRPLLFADDVTMGALVAAMGHEGAVAMVDPAGLPRSWFETIASAGCDRLLCRGIPWRAYPLARVAAAAAAATPPPATDFGGGAGTEPDGPPAGEEARRRLAAAAPPWPSAADRLLWLDTSAQDRWGAATGLEPQLRGRFGTIEPVAAAPAGLPAASAALLVTSHRPLRTEALAALKALALPPAGGCLVMGHPSLAAVVRPLLPAGWKLLALHDVRPADLAPVLEAPGRVDSPGGGG